MLLRAAGTEGEVWSGEARASAYAFPDYEGSGPNTDLPPAELSTIAHLDAGALRDGQLILGLGLLTFTVLRRRSPDRSRR